MSKRTGKMLRCLPGLLVLVVVTSCSRGPTFAEVSGTIRLNGKPMDKAMVEFVPDTEKGATGPNSVGYTDERGQYTLTSYTKAPGAVVGNHRVLIRDVKGYPTTKEGMLAGTITGKRRISDRYGDVAQTPLHKEVKGGAPQTIDLDVTGTP